LIGESLGISENENGDWLFALPTSNSALSIASINRMTGLASTKSGAPTCGHVDNASALPTSPQDKQQKNGDK